MTVALETRIGYCFKHPATLKLALTHPSLDKKQNNQRLEFLGDAVLGLIVAKILYELYPNEQEGELARRHAALVRGETLTKIARDIGLNDILLMANSEVQTGGRETASNLEDALEALIGALYLDGGLAAAEQFIASKWTLLAQNTVAPPKDAKTALQEWAQARGLSIPTYTVVESSGPAHAPQFTIEVEVKGHAPASAQAASKRAAEQAAAASLLGMLNG